jgi:glycerol-3-phosphate dehydrogenase
VARIPVLVIGGGVVGAGILRDLALRGIEAMLLEQGDFCQGASGGNQGMLHSGARYAVKDPVSAKECATESKTLRSIAKHCIDDCGGIFVSLPGDDPGYPDEFMKGCGKAGVGVEQLEIKEALRREPGLSDRIEYAASVKDASIDAFSLTLSNIESARNAGAKALNYQRIVKMKRVGGAVEEVHYQDAFSGDLKRLKPEIVVNAAGAWSAKLAALVQVPLPLTLDKGSMVVVDGRQTHGLINRLRSPADGDIIVPNHSATILGTTSVAHLDPEKVRASVAEVELLRRECSMMLPTLESCRLVRAYARLRPSAGGGGKGRDGSRSFAIVDHTSSGLDNMISLVGGKLTTYRLMAERAVDAVAELLGESTPCRTAREPLSSFSKVGKAGAIPKRAMERMRMKYGPLQAEVADHCQMHRGTERICDCEEVLRGEISYFAEHPDVRTLSDVMRRTRAGMGYCQSSLCASKILSAAWKEGSDENARQLLEDFLAERRKGIEPVLEGEQLRQEIFRSYLLQGTYRLERGEGK